MNRPWITILLPVLLLVISVLPYNFWKHSVERRVTQDNEIVLPDGRRIKRIAQPLVDSIHVEMVGAIKTGIVAIGGETTGATITSKGITWELTFPRHRILLDKLNGKRAKVTGELNVRKGVEVGQRIILSVDQFTVLNDNDDMPRIDNAFKKITVQKSGGFIGIMETTTATADGKMARENKTRRVNESWGLKAEELRELHQLIANTDWARVPRKTFTPRAADLFQYSITIETKNKTYTFEVDDMGLAKVPELGKLIQQFQK